MLLNEGLRMIERTTRQPAENPLAGVRSSLLSGACLIGGVIALVTKGPLVLWVGLFVLAVFFALRSRPTRELVGTVRSSPCCAVAPARGDREPRRSSAHR